MITIICIIIDLLFIIFETQMSQAIINNLKNIKQGDKNLHQHLKKFISQLILDRADLSQFQAYSSQHRISNGINQVVFKVRQSYAHLKDYQVKNRTLISKLNSGTQQQPQEPASIGYVPDLLEQAQVFQKFGLGFGQQQTFKIFKSLARFALKKNAKQLRLWGKIIGSEKDYYIAEGQADGGQEAGELSPDVQPKGVGSNKWSFWACTELTGDWVQLPLITPSQLKISRKIKYIFTGDLTKSVLTNPLFPGKQSHLLKCQLVRIQTSCSLVPKGSLVLNAQTNQIQTPQQYQYPQISALAQKQNWIYQNQSLLKNGRTSYLKPEGLEAQQQEKWLKAQSNLDPSEPKLKNIILDSEKWSIKGYNLQETYKTIGKVPKTISKGYVGIKSLVWPGWMIAAYGNKTSSLYIGYGHKFKQNYYPFDPETVLAQREDKRQFVVHE